MPWTGIVPRGTFQGAVKCVPKLDSLFGRVGRVGSVRVVAVGPLKTRNPERGKEEEREEERQHYHREEEGEGRRSSESRSPHHLNFLCAVFGPL